MSIDQGGNSAALGSSATFIVVYIIIIIKRCIGKSNEKRNVLSGIFVISGTIYFFELSYDIHRKRVSGSMVSGSDKTNGTRKNNYQYSKLP